MGDSDLPTVLANVLARVDSGGLEVRIGRLVVDGSGDSSRADGLVFETWRGGVGASEGGCWSGSPCSGVVMDCYRSEEEGEPGVRVMRILAAVHGTQSSNDHIKLGYALKTPSSGQLIMLKSRRHYANN